MRTELDALLSLQAFFAQVLPEPWDVRTDFEAGAAPVRPFALVEQNGAANTSGAPAMLDVLVPYTVSLFPVQASTRQAATDAALALRETVWQAVKWGFDAHRPIADRIPLLSYDPRVEVHRFRLPWQFAGQPFTITIGANTTSALTGDMSAAEVADAIATILGAAGAVAGVDRGTRLWDISYVGALAGVRIGDPVLKVNGQVPVQVSPYWPGLSVPTAQVLLEGTPAPWRGPSDYARVDSFTQNVVADEADPTLVMIPVDLRLTFTRSRPLPSDQKVLQAIFSSADPDPEG